MNLQSHPNDQPLLQAPESPARYRDQDEISLVDLWLVLVRHRKLIAAVVAIALGAGLLLAFGSPKKYEYVTAIEIGTRLVRDDVRPIDQPETVAAKIKESYLPLVLHEYWKEHPEDEAKYDIRARIPSKSEIIVLEATGPVQKRDVYIALLEAIVRQVKEDHQRIYEVLKKEIEIRRNKAANDLASLKDKSVFLASEIKRVEATKKLLESQITDARKLLATSEQNRAKAAARAKSETDAMTLLLLDNEIRMGREQLGKLEERQKVDLDSKHDELANQVSDVLRKQSEKADELAKLDIELANFRETRALVPPMQSIEPVGVQRRTILALSLLVGIGMGVIGALLVEFKKKVEYAVAKEQVLTTDG